MEFENFIFQAWKVMAFDYSWKIKVLFVRLYELLQMTLKARITDV